MTEAVSHREATGLPSPPPENKSKSSFERVNGRKETHLVSDSHPDDLQTPSVNPDGRTYHLSAAAREESSAPLPSVHDLVFPPYLLLTNFPLLG